MRGDMENLVALVDQPARRRQQLLLKAPETKPLADGQGSRGVSDKGR